MVISFLSSKIILDSINQKSIISETTADNLITTIENNKDKQTQIKCAKCIFKISKHNIKSFDSNHLSKIFSLIESDICDVSVYMLSVMLSGFATVIKLKTLIFVKNINLFIQ
jgi:hypothetical protein